MATQEYFNFRTCCRLCLDENSFSNLDIFSSKNRSDHLAEKINHVIGIQVSANDPVSTSLCSKCFLVVKEFDKFKYQSLINQEKLAGLQSVHDASLCNESIIIKDEPLSDGEDIVYVSSARNVNQQLQIKIERSRTPANLRDELPPILSPNLPTTNPHFELHVEEILEAPAEPIQVITASSNDIDNAVNDIIVNDITIEDNNVNDNNVADKDTIGVEANENAREIVPVNNQRDIIDFAAGLQLQSKAVNINMEPMSQAELQFVSKHEHLYTQYHELRCCCHNNRIYPTRKSLLSHLQKVAGLYYVPYTCLTCYTTYSGRSPFSLHIAPCKKNDSSNIAYAVANRNERDVNKHRIFQSFLCKLCDGVFRLYDLYLQHADEHVIKDIENPCHCGKIFYNANAFKQHILSSCVIRPMCDICYKYYESPEEFKAHCIEVHDNDAGPQFTIANGFAVVEIPFTAQYACAECNLKCRQEMFIVKHLQIAHNYNPDEAKAVAADCFIGISNVSIEPGITNTNVNNNGYELINGDLPGREMDESFQTIKLLETGCYECRICTKLFSNRSNVMRHLNQTHFHGRRSRSIRCGDCDQTFNDMEALTVHLNTEHGFSCKDCGKKCKTLQELERHRTSHLKISLKRDPQTHTYEFNDSNNAYSLDDMPHLEEAVNPQDKKSLSIHCKVCKKLFATPGGLAGHLKKHHPEMALHRDEVNSFPRKCKRCAIVLKSLESWTMHMRNHALSQEGSSSSNSPAYTDDTDYVVCPKCLKVFANRGNLKQHMKSHGVLMSPNRKKRFYCSICKFGSSSAQEWTNHKLIHASKVGKDLFCKHCKVSFESPELLEAHMTQEHDENKPIKREKQAKKQEVQASVPPTQKGTFECNVCGKELHSYDSLRGHIGWHKRPGSRWKQIIKHEPPVLEPCDQTEPEPPKVNIAFPGQLKNNAKNLNKNYVCITCENLFPSSVSLHMHITKMHGKERCPNCTMFFRTPEVLAAHIRQMHVKSESNDAKVVPLVKKKISYEYCKVCGQEFDGIGQLRKHMEKQHPDVPFIPRGCVICPYCKRRFQNTPALSSHVRKHQRDGDELPRVRNKSKQPVGPSVPLPAPPLPTPVSIASAAFKYDCAICGQGFHSGSDMRTHIIKAHPF